MRRDTAVGAARSPARLRVTGQGARAGTRATRRPAVRPLPRSTGPSAADRARGWAADPCTGRRSAGAGRAVPWQSRALREISAGVSRAGRQDGRGGSDVLTRGVRPGRRDHEECAREISADDLRQPGDLGRIHPRRDGPGHRRAGEHSTKFFESGEWIGGEGLADPAHAKVVRVRDGVPAVTDGPYVETKEHLAGYYIVECETGTGRSRSRPGWPDARYGAVEVRPVIERSGVGRCERPTAASRTCCASWRRRCSARWCAATGSSTLCEDAVQEALLAAASSGPARGCPDNPRGWLITVASRRLIDQVRSDEARRRREEAAPCSPPPREPSRPDDERGLRPGRHPDAAVPVLPPGARRRRRRSR